MTIQQQIRVLCAIANISQAELARRIGSSRQVFCIKMKRGSFSPAELKKMAEATGTSFIYKFDFNKIEGF